MKVLDIIKIQRYSLYKLIILLSSLFFLVITVYNVSSDFSSKYRNDYIRRVEINIKNNSVNQSKLIKLSDIENLKSYFSSGDVSCMNEIDTLLEIENSEYPVKAVLSGENLYKFLGLDIKNGTFFSSEQHIYGRKLAVISETLAQKLFTTHNVIGNEISILGSKYKIIGLYKNDDSILSLSYSDGSERVYIPFECLSNSDTKIVNTVFIKDLSLQEEPFRVYKIEDTIKKRLNINLNFYKINDFYNSPIFVSQPLSAVIFFVGICIIFSLIKYFLYYLKLSFIDFKYSLKNSYIFEASKEKKSIIAVFFIFLVLMILFIAAILLAIRFKVKIPFEYIPTDNIFDFEFYAGKVKEAIINLNRFNGYIPTQLELHFKNNLIIIYVLMLCLIINLISVLSAIKLDQIVSDSCFKQIIALTISVLIGLVVSAGFSLICRIQFTFPIRLIAILGLFICVKLINVEKIGSITKKLFT